MIIKSIKRWLNASKQNHIEKMKAQGKCPVCRGKGFSFIISPYNGLTIDCYMCKGTGLYSEWEKNCLN